MPIYEYRCEKCGKTSSFLVRSISDHKTPACPKCGHVKMSRVLSRFASVSLSKTGDADETAGKGPDAGGEMGDLPGFEGLDENDPRSVGRMMRRMAREAGEPMPAEMDEVCRRLEAGEDPEKIEEEMGDLLGDEGGPSGGASGDDTLYEA